MKTRLLFLLLLVCSQLFSENEDIRDHFPSSSFVDTEGLIFTIVDNKVSAISGNFIDNQVDLVVDGPEPLFLSRTLVNSCWDLGLLQTAEVESCFDNEKCYHILLKGVRGSTSTFKGIRYKEDKQTQVDLKISRAEGYTNCGQGRPSGKYNLYNHTIHYLPKKKEFTHKDGGGNLRNFKLKNKHEYLLENEHKASGCHFLYDLCEETSNKITAKDVTKTIPYATLTFGKLNDKPDCKEFIVEGSNGDKVSYKLQFPLRSNQHIKANRLVNVKRSHGYNSYYEYTFPQRASMISEKRIGATHRSKNVINIEYYQCGKNKFTTPHLPDINVTQGQLPIARVKALKNPFGVTHEFIYDFTPFSDEGDRDCKATHVYDSIGNKTTYEYNPTTQRITNIIHRNGADVVLSEKFDWNIKGSLLSKEELNGKDEPLRKRSFSYDKNHNISEEKLEGDLKGLKQTDTFTDWFKYSEDGYNNLIAEGNSEGPVIEYEYLPDTNLNTARFVICDGRIELREFKLYNEHRLCYEEIYDNGSTRDPYTLADVTERLIIKRQPHLEPHLFGKSQSESVYYFENGIEKHLKTRVLGYDEKGRLNEEQIFDSDGNYCYTLKRLYDNCNNVIWECDALGQSTERMYDIFGNVTAERGTDKRLRTEITYDHICRPIKSTKTLFDGSQSIVRLKYDQRNLLTSQTDALGRSKHFTYDGMGRCITELNAFTITGVEKIHTYNAVWKEYDSLGNISKTTLNNSGTATSTYTARGDLADITYSDGSYEKWAYSLAGRKQLYRNRNGVTLLYNHDRLGNIIQEKVIGNDGRYMGTTYFSWKGKRLIQVADPIGNIRTYKYDGLGRLIEEHHGDAINRYSYDSLGRRNEESTFKKGDDQPLAIVYRKFDYLDRVIEEGCMDGNRTCLKRRNYTYDAAGNTIATIYWSSETESALVLTDYDTYNRPLRITDPAGLQTHIEYTQEKDPNSDVLVWVITTTDPTGKQTIEKLDPLDRLSEKTVKDTFGIIVYKQISSYDLGGCLEQCIIDVMEEGKSKDVQTFTWRRDSVGNLIEEISAEGTPEQRIVTHAYTNGLKIRSTLADGNIVTYEYDEKGRSKQVSDSFKTISYGYEYNNIDQVIANKDILTGGLIQKEYDRNNFLAKETTDGIFTLQFSYDPTGQLTQITYPDGSVTKYEYESIRLKSLSRQYMNGKERYRYQVKERNLFGKPLKQSMPGQVGEVSSEYDVEGRTIAILSNYFDQKIEELDKEYKPTKISYKDSQGSWIEEYTYDKTGQLCSEKGLISQEYTYDNIGNRTKSNGQPWKHNAQNQLLETDKTSYSYDANGNLSFDGTNSYRYDALNRLIEITTPDGQIKYRYDSQNRRIQKITSDGIERYAYVKNDEVGTYDKSGQLQSLRILAEGLGSETGATVAIEYEGNYFVPIHDHRGSIRCLINGETKTEESSFRYSAFGEVVSSTGSNQAWQFAGKRFDEETGFTYFGLRYYAPHIGRWTTLDPAGFNEGPNGYVYVHNKPLSEIDLYGMYGRTYENPLASTERREVSAPPDRGRELNPIRTENWSSNGQILTNEDASRISDKIHISYRDKTSASCIIHFIGYEHPSYVITVTNGINNSLEDFLKTLEYISNANGGIAVTGVFNASRGPVLDIVETILQFCGYDPEPVIILRDVIKQNFENGKPTLLFCQSQGTATAYNALVTNDKEVRMNTHVVAIAPSKYIPKDVAGSITHFVSRDFVPNLDFFGRMRARAEGTIVYLDPCKGADFFDHGFQSNTYYRPIQEQFSDFNQKYGRKHAY